MEADWGDDHDVTYGDHAANIQEGGDDADGDDDGYNGDEGDEEQSCYTGSRRGSFFPDHFKVQIW